ncbi:Siphovirus Gp157 [Yersinia frederiksenii]|nr:Siphovirus Gp157 [Yersinia frederiksenii]
MSTTAISLATDYRKLQEMADSGDELTPEMVADTLSGIEGMLEDKFDALMALVRNTQGQAEICANEAKRMSARKKSFDNQAEIYRKYILECMIQAGKDSIKTASNTFTARKGAKKLVITDVNLLPDEYVDSVSQVQIITTPKADEIKAALNEGLSIAGAKFETGERSLAVR